MSSFFRYWLLYVHRDGFVFVGLWPHAAVRESAPPDVVCTCFHSKTKTPRPASPENEVIMTAIGRNIETSPLPLHGNILTRNAAIKKTSMDPESRGNSGQNNLLGFLSSHQMAIPK